MGMSNQLVVNKIRTPDGTILWSRHRHDYVTHLDENGEEYMLDGGTDYIRCSVNKEAPESLAVYTDDDHSVIREAFMWGTRGKTGDSPLIWKPLKDLEIDHINAILKTQTHIPDWVRTIFENELEYRK
jgi:hypothetical protein